MVKFNFKNIELYEENEQKVIKGFIPYNSVSSKRAHGGSDTFLPGAFNKTLSENYDTKAVIAHNYEKPLGRRANGTLKLTDSENGLQVECILGNQSYALDLWESAKREDCNTISFGVTIFQSKFIETGDLKLRQITEARLEEVSFNVIAPAFVDATQGIYTSEEDLGIDLDLAFKALFKETLNKREEDNLNLLYEQVKEKIESFKETKTTIEPLKDTPIYSQDLEKIKRFNELFKV